MADEDRLTRRRYREQQDDQAPDDHENGPASRRAYAAENNRALEEAKTKRLGHKLNWVILGLVIAIIVVFVVLFFTP